MKELPKDLKKELIQTINLKKYKIIPYFNTKEQNFINWVGGLLITEHID